MNRGTRSQLVNDLFQLHDAIDSSMCGWVSSAYIVDKGFDLRHLMRCFTSRKELYLLCVQARSALVSKMILGCVGGESDQAERLENVIIAAQDAFDDAAQAALSRALAR